MSRKMKCVLMSPFLKAQRGNSITVNRLLKGLINNGFDAKALGFCERPVDSSAINGDIVHGFHAFYCGRDILPLLPPDIPFILTMTGTDYNIDLYDCNRRAIVINAMHRANKIVVFHGQAKAQIAQVVPETIEKIYIIPPGIELEGISYDFPLKAHEPFVLIVAGLRKVKNVSLAIDAVSKVRNHLPVSLIHIGPTIEHESALEVNTATNFYSWFTSFGEVKHEYMANFYRHASVVINTSLSEAIPNSILEAMYLERPVIVSNIPGNLAAVNHNVNGLVYTSHEELVNQIITVLNDQQLAHRLGYSAGKFICERFNIVNEVASYIQMYKEFHNMNARE